jgi:hypothetical protein
VHDLLNPKSEKGARVYSYLREKDLLKVAELKMDIQATLLDIYLKQQLVRNLPILEQLSQTAAADRFVVSPSHSALPLTTKGVCSFIWFATQGIFGSMFRPLFAPRNPRPTAADLHQRVRNEARKLTVHICVCV